MIKNVKVTNHLGETLTMELRSPEKSGFFIRSIEGLGPTKNDINLSQSITADGSFFNSDRLNSRNLIFNIGFYNYHSSLTIEQIRTETYRFFPTRRDLTIEIETDTRRGIVIGRVESNEPDIFSKDEGTAISIICPSAFFRERDSVQTFFSGIQSNFQFPFENPSLVSPLIEFGIVFISNQASVIYTGDTPTGVLIVIYFLGAVTDPIIHNASNGENMALSSTKLIALTGQNFKAGDYVLISTISGNKFIHLLRNNIEYNILNVVDILSDWFTIDRGDNVFTYSASSGVNNLQFYIEHQVLYKGL